MSVQPFKARRRRPLPMPVLVTKIISDAGPIFGFSAPSEFDTVSFSLRKAGRPSKTVIYLHCAAQMWSLSAAIDRYPKTFSDARILVQQIAAKHGHEPLEEITKPRMPQARGDDRRTLKDGGCLEAWLSSDIPELWAESMMRCQHPGGFCGQDGFCYYGDCDMKLKEQSDG